MAIGLSLKLKPSHVGGEIGIVENQEGQRVANLMIDKLGASCSCDWPTSEGKCTHLALLEKTKGQKLVNEWPEGRKGKLWNWAS